jgi:signal transduction histidine kinase
VASGLAQRFSVDPTLFRIAFLVLSLAGGFGAAAYIVLWLVIPGEGEASSIAARAVRDRRGIVLSLAFFPALVATMLVGAALNVAFLTTFAWPCFLTAAGVVLVWRNCDPEERAFLRHVVSPVVRLEVPRRRRRRRLVLRIGLGILLFLGGMSALVAGRGRIDTGAIFRPLAGALLVVAGFVVVFGPWWLRVARDLVAEREARARAEDRADMAARVHDSVLQTLAMIQRAADQPQRVVQLARAQERELRAWLFEGDLPGTAADGAASLAAGVRVLAGEVEEAHGVPVDVVTVGDCLLDEPLRAVLGAAREATVNAAKWSGAASVSLFAEVEPNRVSVFVRDRGNGFDPDAVADDRRGITESIQARVLRQGGRAIVRTTPGEGTEVELTMARRGGP